MHWTDKEAQENFDELLDKVDSEGPQLIRRGDQEYWVMNWEQRDWLGKQEDARPHS
jgi:hypothetical protein